jgi:ribonucleoside-triphosphate reductase
MDEKRSEEHKSTITKVKKRDGRIVEFVKEKIFNAIFHAAESVGGKDRDTADKLADKVITILEFQFDPSETPSVEEVQDTVEKILIKNGHAKTAKAFILYRHQHDKLRGVKSTVIDVGNTISEYLGQDHFGTNENSNETYSFSGLLLHTAGKVIKNYILNEVYTNDIRDAHLKGYMHIHDLSHGLIGYCAGWSLKNLLVKGFGGVANKVDAKPAKHLDVAVHQMVNFIGCLQMEFAGAQAFSSVDTLLAPFVKKDKLPYKTVKQKMQELIFSLNIPSRWGSQYPFSNLTFDWVVPDDMKDQKAIVSGIEQDFTYKDCQTEMDMINKAFMEVMVEGDAKGNIFTFPIPTYNLTKDFNWDNENANILFDLTAKYGAPYFQNYIGSNLDPASIRAMCCRLNIDQKELMNRPGGMWGPGDSTGSLGVVTINLNRLGYESKNKEQCFERLKHYMTIAKESLEIKRKLVQKNLDNGLMPFTKVYLGHFRNHFSTIGICGMNEACLNFLGEDLSSNRGKEFAIELMEYMKVVMKEFQEETGNLYNLEATPAESTAYRFGHLDKQMYPDIITAGKEVPYLTNSTHLGVNTTDDVVDALEHQNEIQSLYTGGTIFHTFLGEKLQNGESAKRLVKKIAYNTKIPYFTLTPTFSVCPEHGYIKGEHFKCEISTGKTICDKEAHVYTRIVGYFRPVQNWNLGKKEEYKDRVTYAFEKLGKDFNTPLAKAIER